MSKGRTGVFMNGKMKSSEKMNCRIFAENIQTFIDGNLPDKMYERFINHFNTCPDCNEELEIIFLISYVLKSNDLDSGSLDLRGKLRAHMAELNDQVDRRYRYRLFRFTAIISAQITTLVAFVGFLLYLVGAFS